MPRSVEYAKTRHCEIAYEEQGSGPSALFVHGVFLNGYLWRHVIERVADMRRCIAIDLPAHGLTKTPEGQDLGFAALAETLEQFCQALDLETVDLVGNDSGGGIAQIFAARHPDRLRSLTLTNCDVHDNWPPAAFQPTVQAMADGALEQMGQAMVDDLSNAQAALGVGYEHPERLTEETVLAYLEPFQSDTARRNLQRWFASMDNADTVAVHEGLTQLQTPTLIVWGTGDIFFELKWAYWLRDTIPGARTVIKLEGAKLFFPEERPDELASPLREHWDFAASTAAPLSQRGPA
jgi:pimeloyl-ACP methyl ester carboxylesterase